MKEGEIGLAALKQRDKQVKLRPVLLLKEVPGFGDYLVCGISTQMKNAIEGLHEILKPDSINNLKQISLVRLAFINTVPKDAIRGKIGKIPRKLHIELLERLALYLHPTLKNLIQ